MLEEETSERLRHAGAVVVGFADPIPFRSSLHASIESGHANDCEQYYESVSFWYGKNIELAG